MSRLPALLLLCLLAASPALAGPPTGELAVDALPAGSVRTDGNTPLYVLVRIEDGRVVGFEASTAELANLVITFDSRPEDSAMVTVESKGPDTFKLDLYISPDEKTYHYTSSCPVGMTFETWPHPVPWLAIGGIRTVEADAMSACI